MIHLRLILTSIIIYLHFMDKLVRKTVDKIFVFRIPHPCSILFPSARADTHGGSNKRTAGALSGTLDASKEPDSPQRQNHDFQEALKRGVQPQAGDQGLQFAVVEPAMTPDALTEADALHASGTPSRKWFGKVFMEAASCRTLFLLFSATGSATIPARAPPIPQALCVQWKADLRDLRKALQAQVPERVYVMVVQRPY